MKEFIKKTKKHHEEELSSLKKDLAELQARFTKVESIAVQMNQKNKQLSDELSQLYEIIHHNTHKSPSEHSIPATKNAAEEKKREEKVEKKKQKKEKKKRRAETEVHSPISVKIHNQTSKKVKGAPKSVTIKAPESEMEDNGPPFILKKRIQESYSISSLSD